VVKLLLLQRSEGGCDDDSSLGEEAYGDVAKESPWALLLLDGVMLGDIFVVAAR